MNRVIVSLGAVAILVGFFACGGATSDNAGTDAGLANDGSVSPVGDAANEGPQDASTGHDAGGSKADASVNHDAGSAADASVPSKDAGSAAPGHDVILGGAAHKSGNTDPLKNCVSCHGSTLKGGEGPSCYSCHDSSGHTTNHHGVMHRPGNSVSDGSCNPCHGPNNTGGLGPACASCH